MRSAIAIALLAATVLVFFSGVLFGDRVLITSNPARMKPWDSLAEAGDLAAETYRTDALLTYLPRRVQLTRSLRQGRLPLWNPYIFCGMPFLADPQSRALYPFSILLSLADPLKAMGYDVAVHFFMALLGLYLFLRTLGASRPGSVAGALLYGFSSFFVMRMGHPTFVASASYIPWLFYAYEKARVHHSRWTVALIFFLALGYLSGFPQVFLLGVLALAVYALHDFVSSLLAGRGREGLRSLSVLLIAGPLSAAVVAAQLVPFAEFIGNSVGLGFDFSVMAKGFVWEPGFHLRSIFPGFFGNPVEGTSWLLILKPGHHQYNTGFMVYCGAGAVALAIAGLALVRSTRAVRGLFIILALAVGVASSALILRIAYAVVPPIAYSQIDRAAVIACFALAAIGGFTLSELICGRLYRYRTYVMTAMAVLVIAVLSFGIFFRVAGDEYISMVDARAETLGTDEWLRTASVKVGTWVAGREGEWFAYVKSQLFKGTLFAVPACLLIALLASLGRRGAASRTALGALLFVLLAVDIFALARSYYVSQPSRLLAETDGIRYLKSAAQGPGGWRLASLAAPHRVLPANTPQIYGLSHLDGMATVSPQAHADLLAKHTWAGEVAAEIGGSVGMADVLWAHDMGCARYMLAPEVLPGVPADQYRLVYSGDLAVYENLRAREKGICIPREEVSIPATGGDDAVGVAVFMADPRRRSRGSVSTVSYEPERVELRVAAEVDCFMVFQDTYYPGWRAEVDGEEVPLRRTDLGFRAIEIERGEHTVVMDFRPRSFIIGMVITLAGIAMSVAYGIKTKARSRA